MSLRLRLTLWYSGILACTFLLFGIALYYFLNFYIYNSVEKELKDHAERALSRIETRLSLTLKGLVLDLELQDRDLYSTNTFLQLYNVNLDTFSQSANLQYYDVSLPLTEQVIKKFNTSDAFYLRAKVSDQSLLIYHLAIKGSNQSEGTTQLLAILQVAIPIQQYENFFIQLKYMLFIIALLTIFFAAGIGWFFTRSALMPIEHVIQSADLIQKEDDLDKRITYKGPSHDEIGRLTYTINQMLARIQKIYQELEEAYRAQRRFVSDASHELRTPLTTIRGNIEFVEKLWNNTQTDSIVFQETMAISKESLHDIAEESSRMTRLVNDLLVLARADTKVSIEKRILEFRSIVEEVARKSVFLPRTVTWQPNDFSDIQEILIYGNRDYVQQLLFIFIENAFKYTSVGHVKMQARITDHQVGIEIIDTGVGMDEQEIPHIFERFYRADESRGQSPGTGLGLSIAKWIIDEHQGSIEVMTKKGLGTTFIIWIPIYFPDNDPSDIMK